MALRVLQYAQEVLAKTAFDHDSLDQALREAPSLSSQSRSNVPTDPSRRLRTQNAPPLFETLVVLGRETCLTRIRQAEASLQSLA